MTSLQGHSYLHNLKLQKIVTYAMTIKKLVDIDPRLAKRHQQLVTEHLNSTDTLSADLRALPDKNTSFAITQAAWRFYKNDRVTLTKLHEPLLIAAHEGIATHCSEYALCVHDWSRLNYRKHASKLDKYQITHETDVGYDLQSSIILSDQTGQPIAPVAQRLVTANGSYATYQERELSVTVENHLDEVTYCIDQLEQQNFAKPLVHIIDREADSIGHIRQWEANNCLWLTRSKKTSSIEFQGQSMPCAHVAEALHFEKIRQVDYHGNPPLAMGCRNTDTNYAPCKTESEETEKTSAARRTHRRTTGRESYFIG